jgi:hypothetical protein
MRSTYYTPAMRLIAMVLLLRTIDPAGAQAAPIRPVPPLPHIPLKTSLPAAAKAVQIPLTFEADGGPAERAKDFVARGQGYSLHLSPREATFQFAATASASPAGDSKKHGRMALSSVQTLTMRIAGGETSTQAVQQAVPTGHANYFIGRDPAKWRTGIPLYDRVKYRQVYRGIDLVYYGNQHRLEYDFLVRPGGDPTRIALKFTGAHSLRISPAGDLVLRLKQGEIRWHRPLTYQTIAGKKCLIGSAFVLKKGGEVGFALARYDRSRALTIDPTLLYSTLLGGTNQDTANALAVDSAGNTYVVGTTRSKDFPTTPGSFEPVNKYDTSLHPIYLAPNNVFVAKLNPAGTALLYATYLSGTGDDRGVDIAIDKQGCAYVTGIAGSPDFPVTPGAFLTVNLASQVFQLDSYSVSSFVTKLNATGSALVYSTYLSGHLAPSASDVAHAIAVDDQGNAYITGSANSPDFPTTPGAFQKTSPAPGANGSVPSAGYVAKLNASGTSLLYATYLGGSKGSNCKAIAVDSQGNAYVTGETTSLDFPTTPTAFQKTNNVLAPSIGGTAFVAKLNAVGTGLLYATYLGGSGQYGDQGNGIAVDSGGNAYVCGSTSSPNFPTTPGALPPARLPSYKTVFNVFVAKLNQAGTGLRYGTDLGEGNAYAIAVDRSGNACITGDTSAVDFPTTAGAYVRTNGPGNTTAFVTRLNATATALLYSTYLGGHYNNGFDIALDNRGTATFCGSVMNGDYPTTPQAFQPTSKASLNTTTGFVTRLSTNPVFPDFNNDGHTDLLLRNRDTGVIGTWLMDGATVLSGVTFARIPPASYTLVGNGDFVANGVNTLVFQDSVDNRVIFWNTAGAAITNIAPVPRSVDAGWKLVGVADFNQDGRSDLLFQNQTTGRVVIWNMNGLDFVSGVSDLPAPSAEWKVVGTGDFNADGFTDLVFQNQTTGQIKLWFMQGGKYLRESALNVMPEVGWKVVGVGDYNGDGLGDLLLQNQTTNSIVVWYLNGALYQGGSGLSQRPPTEWKVVGPR